MKQLLLLLDHDLKHVLGTISLTPEGEKLLIEDLDNPDGYLSIAAGGKIIKYKEVGSRQVIDKFELLEVSILK